MRKNCECKGCTLWLRLEAERIDQSYKGEKKQPEPKTIIKTVEKKVYISNEKRDKMYFDAGRYAAGARDKVAEAAHTTLMRSFDEDR